MDTEQTVAWLENILNIIDELGSKLDEVSKRPRNENSQALYDALTEEKRRLFSLHDAIVEFIDNERRAIRTLRQSPARQLDEARTPTLSRGCPGFASAA